jgi:hypothetical protein
MGMLPEPIPFRLNDHNLRRLISDTAKDSGRVFVTPHAKKRIFEDAMYHYTESGLRNVWLENGVTRRKTAYGVATSIQDVDGLHKVSVERSRSRAISLAPNSDSCTRDWICRNIASPS